MICARANIRVFTSCRIKGMGPDTRRHHCRTHCKFERETFQKDEDITVQKIKRRNKGLLYRSWRYFSALLGLQHCYVCQKALSPTHDGNTRLAEITCASCLTLLRQQRGARCQQCGLELGPRPQAFGWKRCRHCKTNPIEHIHALVCANYVPPFDRWIPQLKYGQQLHFSKFLGAWLADCIVQSNIPKPHALIPVPSTPRKLKQRGYNQAQLIAKALGQELNIPVYTTWLEKIKDSKTQADLNRQARLENQQGIYRATRPLPSNTTIGLVDDVITTGATTQHCAQALMQGGTKQVLILAICRTPE